MTTGLGSPAPAPSTAGAPRATPGRIRARGLLFVLLGFGLFVAGLAIAASWRQTPPLVLVLTVFVGLGLVPKGALELITGRHWMDNPQWVRVVALVVGIPGFIALLAYGMYLVFNH